MKISRNKLFALFAIISMVMVSMMAATGNAAYVYTNTADRKTAAYVIVSPILVGKGQTVTVDAWVFPAPSGPSFQARDSGVLVDLFFENYTVTFTRPDGTKDTFMPENPSITQVEGPKPGKSESLGTTYFFYTPTQVGTWTVSLSFPGKTFGEPNPGNTSLKVRYLPSTSQTFTFQVQEDPVNAGLINGYPFSPLPTGYWTTPINSRNREWATIAGGWLQTGYDESTSGFNPYSTAPNTPHVLWKRLVNMNGVASGDWGSLGLAKSGTTNYIMHGKVFVNDVAGGTFSCYDLRTGEKKYTATGSITNAWHSMADYEQPGVPRIATSSVYPYLWGVSSSSWKLYEPTTGAATVTITNVPSDLSGQRFLEGDTVVYMKQMAKWNTTAVPLGYAVHNLIKWDYAKVTGNNWMTGIVWNVSLRLPNGASSGDNQRGAEILRFDDQGVVIVFAKMETQFMAFDMTTGAYMYTKDTGVIHVLGKALKPIGCVGFPNVVDRVWNAYDVKTGTEKWTSDVMPEAWDSGTRPTAVAYNTLYSGTFSGHIYAIDLANGKIKFQSESLPDLTGETVYGTTTVSGPSYNAISIADGKIYWSAEPPWEVQPRPRSFELICQDAYTGKILWRTPGSYGGASLQIAEGYMIGYNDMDGTAYCFGKGKTQTDVSIQNDVIAKGASTMIKGTVLDMSPAAPNTPAIADESMAEYMDYLHWQNATLINTPPTPKGVSVLLYAIDPNGNYAEIGTVTSDSSGMFKKLWTPAIEGEYTVYATFMGSESYWTSSDTTALGVNAVAPTSTPTQTATNVDNSMLLYGILVAVIVAIIVGLLAIFKKP
jgi:hypothetical protein